LVPRFGIFHKIISKKAWILSMKSGIIVKYHTPPSPPFCPKSKTKLAKDSDYDGARLWGEFSEELGQRKGNTK